MTRYQRQIAFAELGRSGQEALERGRVAIIGVGGLGSWIAELLARAGVGFLRLVDDDVVSLSNIHRQALFAEFDAIHGKTKVEAAFVRIQEINQRVMVEPVFRRCDRLTISKMADDVHVIVDGTDNWTTRFLINEFAVSANLPWIMGGVIRSEAVVMAVLPGQTACLRCLIPFPDKATPEDCRRQGVLGPVVSAIASYQAMETVKILSGNVDKVRRNLIKLDLWNNRIQHMELKTNPACVCCQRHEYDQLAG